MNIFVQKFKECVFSVVPIVVLVLILNFTAAPLETTQLVRFLIGAVFIIIGLAVFLVGVDLSIDRIGQLMGGWIAKTNKLLIVIIAGIFLGFVISIAEPDLHILADQVDMATGGFIPKFSIVAIVSIGIAFFLAAGLSRIVYNIPINKMLTVIYAIILILALFTSSEFISISFDASGATTGALTVPFMLALAVGVSSMKKDSKSAGTDSFGLVGITSAGAIVGVMFMSIFSKSDEIQGSVEAMTSETGSIIAPFLHELTGISLEILIALAPILIIFLIFQKATFKLSKHSRLRVLMGLLYSFLGLVLFLTGVNAGFMEVGALVGHKIASMEGDALLILVGFILGIVTILAEPAVYVLTNQIENVTSGYVKRKTVLAALSVGVGVSVALSIIRIVVPGLQLWHLLLPGYIISIAMSYFVPNLFVGIAFDSGGVASGPMTATFILAFAQGAAEATEGANVLLDGFGVIAMVAMTPLIALQLLGLIYKIKSRKGGVTSGNNS